MARAHTQIAIQRGDVVNLNECPGKSFFIAYFDDTMKSSVVVDDDAWTENEAFANLLLDTIAKRRALKALAVETA